MKPENTVPKADPVETELGKIHEVLVELVKQLVKDPDEANVESIHRGALVAYSIKAKKEDRAKVVGSQGRHIRALERIAKEAALRVKVNGESVQAHMEIDEQYFVPRGTTAPNMSEDMIKKYGEYKASRFKNVKTTLRKAVSLFVPGKVTVELTELGSMMIAEVSVSAEDYPLLHGKEEQFYYGPDGAIIGSIKCLFDGIAKNGGRVIKIAVKKI